MAKENRLVSVEGKNFVGIGKMMLDNLNSDWNIPHLHFIVNKTPSGNYEATNIELILDAIGETIEESIERLSELTIHHITAVMTEGPGYEQFIEIANTTVMEDYWKEYRNIEFSLARKGKDLSHELSRKINAAIKTMLADEIKAKIKEIAEDVVDTIITGLNVEIKTLEAA
ncbi:hypothetical protein FACS1894200_09290 [Spirochaetia bacterium]|nr:hypothetical protein FACS1894200_09290 [Spirochaetia bacterium]